MFINTVLLVVLSIFLAANMGISGFSVAFAPSFGSGILKKRAAVLLYVLGVAAGGLMFGPKVTVTLTQKISSQGLHGISPILIIIACCVTMFASNLLKVPQSTSFVTVASFAGAGIYFGNVNWATIIRILGFAFAFSALSFLISYLIKRAVYPPRPGNMKIYELFFEQRGKFRKFIIGHDIYAAFSVGSNNIANVAAPIAAFVVLYKAGFPWFLFLTIGIIFGFGAYVAGERVIRSVSKDIIPVGEFSASIVSIITATFVLAASWIGLPTPYVQFTTFALFGISCVKDGFGATFSKAVVKKIICVWIIVPVFAAILSYLLHALFMKG